MAVTDQVITHGKIVVSLFPGVGLLDMAFEQAGFCVLRGPDKIFGGDIRAFHPPEGHIWGVIGGPPCQEFSGLRRLPPTGYGVEMLIEFARCVTEAKPEWWLMENVARVPNVAELGHIYTDKLANIYTWQRFDMNQAWYCDVTRLRHIQFGSLSGRLLNVTRRSITNVTAPAALASDDRPFQELLHLQGLPPDFDLPGFLAVEKKRAVGNGVPLPMGRALARAVIDAYSCDLAGSQQRLCLCGCGRPVTGRAKYAANEMGNTAACRKRSQRNRNRSVTPRGVTV